MSSISEVLNKQLNCIQRDQIKEMQTSIEKLQNRLKSAESLAEKRRQYNEMLEFDKQSLLRQSKDSIQTKIKEILGVKQMVTSDEEILSEIRDYKNSTVFWRRKYHDLYSDIESLVEKLEISEMGHKTDQTGDEKILSKVRIFIRRIESLKSENIKLYRQTKEKDNYCQTLIDLRNRLNLQIDSLKEESLRITKERDSLKDKCFWQNSLIQVFEDMKKIHLRPIDDLNTKLKASGAVEAIDAVHNFETPNRSKSFDDFGVKPISGQNKYWLRSASKESPFVSQLLTNSISPKVKRLRKESKLIQKKLFI